MDETKIYTTGGYGWSCGYGVWGFVIFLLILGVAIWTVTGHKETRDRSGENFRAICDAEKSQIINTARGQYLTEQQGAETRAVVEQTAHATQQKIDFYAYQDLRDRLSRAEMDNYFLKGQIASDARFNAIENRLSSISCNMLTKPDVTGVGVCCPNAAILNGLGINSLNNGCNSCCSGNVLV